MSADLGLGCWAFGGGYWYNQQRSDSIRTLHAAIRGGIRHFDTAQAYGKGLSEQITGQQLKRFSATVDRSSITLASKLFLPAHPDDLNMLIHRSLRRLCTSYLDILYIHWPDSSKHLEPYLVELERLRDLGLFHALGVSNFTVPLLEKAMRISDIGYCQIPVSLMWPKSLTEIQSICTEGAIRIVGYSPLGLGLLSGRYRDRSDFDVQDRRRDLFVFDGRYEKAYRHLLASLSTAARSLQIPQATIALAWARSRQVHTILTGARTKEQVQAVLTSTPQSLPLKVMQDLDEASDHLASLIPEDQDNLFFHRW